LVDTFAPLMTHIDRPLLQFIDITGMHICLTRFTTTTY